MPAKAASLALQCVLPYAILDVSLGFTSLSPVEGTKKAPTEAAWNTSASAGACKPWTPCIKMVAVVCAGCVRAPVTSHAWSILRESPRDCKCFGASSGKAPSSGRGSRAWGGFQAWESRTVRGVQARRADQPRHAVLLDAAAPRHTTMGAPCDAGQVWPSGVPWGCHV